MASRRRGSNASRRHVDGLFEIWAVEWVGFVEDRERHEPPIVDDAVQGVLTPLNELLDDDVVRGGVLQCAHIGSIEQPGNAREGDV